MKKLKIIALALTISITGSAFLKAADAVKTLPLAIYQQMKHGKKLENVWVGNDYDKTKGFKVNAVEYKAEIRNGAVMDYLPKALATLAKDDSPVTLQVVVTRVTTKAFTGFGNAMGKVFVEGKISDATGKIIAAFTTSGSAGNWGDAADDFQLACDKIASGIATDLLAKSNNGLEVAIPVMPPTVASDTVNSEVLTNDSIVQLVKADMSEEIVINMIKTQPTRFDVGVGGILALKTNGVSDKIINEMVLRGQGASTTLQARPTTLPPDSVKVQVRTPVRLIVDEPFSSGSSKSGQEFRLKVAENVTVDGKVVIAKGTVATGRITVARKSSIEADGILEFTVDSVQAIDGQNISLEAHVAEGGRMSGFGVGKDVKFEIGYSVTAVVESDKEVDLNKVPEVVVPTKPTIATTNIITDPAVAKLCEQLEQDNPGKVKDALNKLRDKKLKDNASQAVPKILPCLANSKPDVVREALKTLAAIGNPDAVPAILPLLTNDRPDIIREACRTLADIGNKDTIPSLEPLLTNLDHGIRDEAYKAITKLRAKS